MNIKTLENDLYWQEYVLNKSKDPVQIERVKKAITTLNGQIAGLKAENDALRKQLKTVCNALMERKLT
jgi:capsule polysaccharide export protein KpsE/RkpR